MAELRKGRAGDGPSRGRVEPRKSWARGKAEPSGEEPILRGKGWVEQGSSKHRRKVRVEVLGVMVGRFVVRGMMTKLKKIELWVKWLPSWLFMDRAAYDPSYRREGARSMWLETEYRSWRAKGGKVLMRGRVIGNHAWVLGVLARCSRRGKGFLGSYVWGWSLGLWGKSRKEQGVYLDKILSNILSKTRISDKDSDRLLEENKSSYSRWKTGSNSRATVKI